MINLPKNRCTACAACMAVCPVDAIEIKSDGLYGKFPVVDPQKCIHCDACDRVCPESGLSLRKAEKAYAAVSTENDRLVDYASGGVATEMSKAFIYAGGVVYGSVLLNSSEVRHMRFDKAQDVSRACGSKYVFSDISSIFQPLKSDLKNNLKVLFIGTPCQVAAVRSFASKFDQGLFTIDLICHGVPSGEMLDAYVGPITRKLNTRPSDTTLNFRWKRPKKNGLDITFGTRMYNLLDGRLIFERRYPRSTYMAAFFNGISYRENCHNCRYASIERAGDLTIGDFWGLTDSNLNSSKGVSAILVNSDKGSDLVHSFSPDLALETHPVTTVTSHNRNLNHPVPRTAEKKNFFEAVETLGFDRAVKRFVPSFNKEKRISYRIYLALAKSIYNIRARLARK